MTIDEFIIKKITSNKYIEAKYPKYFLPEINSFIKDKWIPEHSTEEDLPKKIDYNFHILIKYLSPEIQSLCKTKEHQEKEEQYIKITKLPDNFNELRKQGENDNYLCKLIREDLIQEFITYLNKNSISPKAEIKPSIYETNPFFFI